MKTIISILFLFSYMCNNACSNPEPQNYIGNVLGLKQIILLDSDFIEFKKIKPKIVNNEIFILYDEIFEDENQFFYKLKCYNSKETINKIFYPDSLIDARESNRFRIWDWAIHKNNLFLLKQYYILIFEKENHDYFLRKKIDIPETYFYLTLKNDNIYIYHTDPYKPDSMSTFITKYNLNDFSYDKIILKPPYKPSLWLLQPRRMIDFDGTNLLINDVGRYQIRIYDESFNQYETLTYTPKTWVIDTANPNLKSKNLSGLKGILQTSSLIQSVRFVGKNKLFVSRTSPPDSSGDYYYKLFFDIWIKQDSNWKIGYHDMQRCKINNDNEIYSPAFQENFFVSEGKILNIIPLPFEANELKDKTVKEVNELKDNYFAENKPRYSLIIWEIKWP